MHLELKSWGLNCRKCCASTTATTFEFDYRCALQVFPQTACFKKFNLQPSKPDQTSYNNASASLLQKLKKWGKISNPKNEQKKPRHFFNTEPILEFSMFMINTTENSLTKRQILSLEQCMVRKTWSHTLNRKKSCSSSTVSPLQ